MIGLQKGTVRLVEHETDWEHEALSTIAKLKSILGNEIIDIQHVGSTSIKSICAKPIIDIAVLVSCFESVLTHTEELEANGFYYRPKQDREFSVLLACGSYYDGTGDLQTHFIHVVRIGSSEYSDYINFRNYMNTHPDDAKRYVELKMSLEKKYPCDRNAYIEGKSAFIRRMIARASAYSYLGKGVEIVIDRPAGSVHPKHHDIVYPVNYGYIPEVFGGDGEELDVYLLGTDSPVERCSAVIYAVIYRNNDNEDKLIAVADGVELSIDEIADAVSFQEKYFDITIEKAP